jgi:hypothetical protein
MSKLTGPLLSMGARGAIGKTLVASTWKGQPYMRQYVIPANPQTSEQSLTRTAFSFLNALWLVSPALFRAPWAAAAVGQKYTDRNKLQSSNLPLLRPAADCQDFIASPGSLGGLPLDSMTAVTGTTPGGFDWTATPPSSPTGWTLAGVTIVAFPDQDSADAFGGPIVAAEDTTSTYGGNLGGLPESTLCVVCAFPRWTRPDGRTAYGPSINTTVTTDAT